MKKFSYILLVLILLVNFSLRLYKIDSPIADWHSWRQADTASVSRLYVKNGVNLFAPKYQDLSSVGTGYNNPEGYRFVEFPIYNAIHAEVYKLYPKFSLEKWGRLLAVLFSTISAFFVFLIGRRFLGTKGGLLSSLIFAVLPFNIYFSRVILPEPMAVAAITSSLWFFIRFIDDHKWELAISAVLFALALLLKPYTAFYLIPMAYLAFSKFGVKRIFSQIELWLFLLSFVPLLLWRGYMNAMNFLPGIPFWKWAFNGDNIRFKPSFFWWIFEERLGRLILGTWGVVPFVFGFLTKIKDDFKWFLPSLFVGQVAYWLVVATANVRHDYYQTLSIPAISIILAGGIMTLWNLPAGRQAQKFDTTLRRTIVVVCLALSFAFSFYQVKEYYKINHPEIIVAGAAVNRLTPTDAKVIATYDGDTAFLYQTNRSGWPFVTLPIDEMVNRLGAQYYVSVSFDKQTEEIMSKYKVIEKTNEYVVIKLND